MTRKLIIDETTFLATMNHSSLIYPNSREIKASVDDTWLIPHFKVWLGEQYNYSAAVITERIERYRLSKYTFIVLYCMLNTLQAKNENH